MTAVAWCLIASIVGNLALVAFIVGMDRAWMGERARLVSAAIVGPAYPAEASRLLLDRSVPLKPKPEDRPVRVVAVGDDA